MNKIPIPAMHQKAFIETALLSYITAIEGKNVDGRIISRREAVKRFLIDIYGEADEDKLNHLCVTAQRLITWRNSL